MGGFFLANHFSSDFFVQLEARRLASRIALDANHLRGLRKGDVEEIIRLREREMYMDAISLRQRMDHPPDSTWDYALLESLSIVAEYRAEFPPQDEPEEFTKQLEASLAVPVARQSAP